VYGTVDAPTLIYKLVLAGTEGVVGTVGTVGTAGVDGVVGVANQGNNDANRLICEVSVVVALSSPAVIHKLLFPPLISEGLPS